MAKYTFYPRFDAPFGGVVGPDVTWQLTFVRRFLLHFNKQILMQVIVQFSTMLV